LLRPKNSGITAMAMGAEVDSLADIGADYRHLQILSEKLML